MTIIAVGIQRTVAYKKEVTYGVDPGATGAQFVPRVTSALDLDKDTYESQRQSPDYQTSDMRHGVRKIGGDIKDEMSCGTWQDFFATIVRKAWAAGATTGAHATFAGVAGPPQKIHRSAGSFLTDGFKIGDIVVMTGWATTMAVNNNRDYRIIALTGADMTLAPLNTSVGGIVTLAEGDSVTISVKGKKTFMPTTGHTNDSYTIEHAFNDIVVFERFNGVRIASCAIEMPSTGMSTLTWGTMGQNAVDNAGVEYFTTPTAAVLGSILAAVNGKLMINGVDSGLITSLSLKIDAGMTTGSTVGSNQTPDVFVGRMRVSGQVGVYFADATLRDAFWNESVVSLAVALSEDNSSGANAMNFVLPKIKLGKFSRADGEGATIATAPFTALRNIAGGVGLSSEDTTMSIQDTSLS